jgi:hypothetical protein
LRGA